MRRMISIKHSSVGRFCVLIFIVLCLFLVFGDVRADCTPGYAVAVVISAASVAFPDFTPPTLSTAEYAATAGAVFTAIGAIWGLRKVIKLLNRSLLFSLWGS